MWSDLVKHRRLRIAAVGYLAVIVFGAVVIICRSVFELSASHALLAGGVAAAPVILAVVGDRITGLKFLSVEISLAQVTVPIQGQLSDAVMDVASMGGSAAPDLSGTLVAAIQDRSRLLRLNLRNDDYWWSTRVFLTAALADDYTLIEQLVFVRRGAERDWVGMVAPKAARRRLTAQFPSYERAYRQVRSGAVIGDVAPTPAAEIASILMNWPALFPPSERSVTAIVTPDLLREWLRQDLDTGSLPYGPLTPLLRYGINQRPNRYTGLTMSNKLLGIVDGQELARRTTEEVLRRQLM